MRPWRWLVALVVLLFGRRARQQEQEQGKEGEHDDRIVAAGTPERRAEVIVVILLGIASLFAVGFIVTYALFSPLHMRNDLLGICLGACFLFIAAAFGVIGKRLVVTEELEEEYPDENPEQQQEVAEIIRESGSRITRKRLLMTAGAATAGALGAAAITPAVSLGPIWDTGPLDRTPWRRGVRLVDEHAKAYLASDIEERTFYTAFPEGANPEDIGSPLVVIRVDPTKLDLPPGRSGWAPDGILAFSKICTHAACAVALYRKPTFSVLEPNDALICPCHYSTFDPFTGGTVIYGPAGRPLPQLPLMVDSGGYLAAAGNFSARVGPSWWNVRSKPTSA